MRYFYKVFASLSIVVALMFLLFTPLSRAESVSIPLISAQDDFQAGVAAFQMGNYPLATQAFTRSIEQNPGFAAAYSNRCLTYLETADYPLAIADCTQGLKLDSTNVESYLNRGLAHYRLGEYAAAIADYTQLLQLKPDDYRAYYNLGLAQFALGDFEAAIASYDQSLSPSAFPPNSEISEIYDDRGVVYLLLDKQTEAIADFGQAIEFNKTDSRAYFNRACAYSHQGNYTAALEDFDQVLALAPDHAQTYFNRGLLHHAMGRRESAVEDLEKAAQSFYAQGEIVNYRQTLSLLEKIQLTALA